MDKGGGSVRDKKPINVRVGANIQKLREEQHYTQEELSEKLGVTPNHLSAIERGVSGISLELLEKLCQVLLVTSDHILFGYERMEIEEEDVRAYLHSISELQAQLIKTVTEMAEAVKKLTE